MNHLFGIYKINGFQNGFFPDKHNSHVDTTLNFGTIYIIIYLHILILKYELIANTNYLE